MAVFIALGIILLIAILSSVKSCVYGVHEWYTSYNCGTYDRTGPLPGESTTHNGQGVGGYRYERHCLCCERLEYSKRGKWTEFKLSEGETLFRRTS